MTSAALSTAPSALDAAAERVLADLRTKRERAAEAALNDAKQRLAEAQQAEATIAGRYALHRPGETNPERTRLVEARNEVEVATAMVAHHERELTKARARHTSAEKAAAAALVAAEREAASLPAKLQPISDRITQLTGELIEQFYAAMAAVNRQHLVHRNRENAAATLGIEPPREGIIDPARVTSLAVLAGCHAASFNPFEFDLFSDAADLARSGAVIPTPGARAHLGASEDRAERDADTERRSMAHREAMLVLREPPADYDSQLAAAAQAERDAIVLRDRQQVEGSPHHRGLTDHANGRASLYEAPAPAQRRPGRSLFDEPVGADTRASAVDLAE